MTSDSTPHSREPVEPGNRMLAVLAVLALSMAASAWVLWHRAPAVPTVATQDSETSPATPPALLVRSTPDGASVFLNGQLAGATPLRVEGLTPGSYGLRLERQGFETATRDVAVKPGTQDLAFELRPAATGTLVVEIEPKGSEVYLDTEFIGLTPLRREGLAQGVYELYVARTNRQAHHAVVEVRAGETAEFAGFALKDLVLDMLERAIVTEPQRVSHYMDLGHYLFVNDRLEEAARQYARALKIAAKPLEFGENVAAEERRIEQRIRAEDINRLNDEIRKKSHWPRKDVARFREILNREQEDVAETNVQEWPWVQAQADNFAREGKFQRAESLYMKHIDASKSTVSVPQAQIALITLRLRMKNVTGVKDAFNAFNERFGKTPELARQCANAIYTSAVQFEGNDREEVLKMAETLLRRAVQSTPRRSQIELNALCKFELGNVLVLQERREAALEFYRDSVEGTADASTKELRRQRWADNLRAMGSTDEARAQYTELASSPREHIANQARQALKDLDAAPQPEKK